MRQSNPQQRRLRFRQFDSFSMNSFTVAVWLMLLTATATVAEAPTLIGDPKINDFEEPAPKSVARVLLEIQQRLGGSIVADRQLLQEYPSNKAIYQGEVASGSESAVVESLRDAAWLLDQSAEKLERSELYQQADALRNLAQQFRLDARAIRAQPGNKDVGRATQP